MEHARKGGARKIFMAAILAAALGSAHAGGAQDQAVDGAFADALSTAVGLAAGAAELNPVGPVLAIGMKVVYMRYARDLPDTDQPAAYAMAAAWWQGAAANNLCIAASVLSGGAFAPACIALGVAWGLKTWKDSEPEREFWQGCAMLRAYAHEPQMPCIYTPPGSAVAQAAAVTD